MGAGGESWDSGTGIATDGAGGATLSFTAWTQFKQNNPYPGTWRATSTDGAV